MWLVGVVSRRRVWLVRVGGIYGCNNVSPTKYSKKLIYFVLNVLNHEK